MVHIYSLFYTDVILRVIAIGNVPFFFSPEGDEHFKNAWRSIASSEELVCTKTGTRHGPLPKPKAIILDVSVVTSPAHAPPVLTDLNQFFAAEPFKSIRDISGDSVKIFSWFCGLTYAMFFRFGPVHLGGKGNLRLLIEEEVGRSGRPFKEVAQEVRKKAFRWMQLMY